jgi:TDG/mug DNA glycosylase family protein
MVDRRTVEVYERYAREWTAARRPRDHVHAAWVERNRIDPLAVVDIGCGPGWGLAEVNPPRIALDPVPAMLDLVPGHAPGALPVLASVGALPFRPRSLGGAIANRVLVHLPRGDVPLALAEVHRVLAVGAPLFVRVFGDEQGSELRGEGPFGGRLFSAWCAGEFEDLCAGAGFDVVAAWRTGDDPTSWQLALRLRRALTLPDTVGPGMRLLVCGLNPSIYAAEAGIGFARPGNRFWPAALAAGIVSSDRDPRRALLVDRVGMTDIVKRATRRADELTRDEFERGLERVERLVALFRPGAVCFVGLAGWRAAVDGRAVAGVQDRAVGGRPVYLMPSTSGLNAHATPADLKDHLRAAARLADASATGRP